ncbi:MAG: UvrD-helicase domain-containing protein, partial [Opitutales bacterium]
ADLIAMASAVQSFEAQADAIVQEFLSYQGKLNGSSYKAKFFEEFESFLRRVLADPIAQDLDKICARTIRAKFKKDYKETELQSGFFAACEELEVAKRTYEPDFLRCFDTWFIEAFKRLKLERGLMTYDDMILDLDRALMRSGSLKSQVRERYKAALVDEFQDTDDRQYHIFRLLFGGNSEANRYFAMIGDPKQSIYAFRGADITAYLAARHAADRCYTLPVNYRSEASLIAATNAFFENANLGAATDGGAEEPEESIPFVPVSAADNTAEKLVFAGGDGVDRLYERELRHPHDGKVKTAEKYCIQEMADDLRRLLDLSAQGRVYFESVATKTRRPVQTGDIAVLVDTHDEAAVVHECLLEHDIVSVRSKTGKLLETEEAREFLYFLMACLNPGERVVNRLLVSPLYGKSSHDLKAMPERERREIHEFFTVLGHRWRDGCAVSLIWMQFLDQIGLRERLLQTKDGERKVTNYLHISEFVQELERIEGLSPERLQDRLWQVMQDPQVDTSGEKEYLVRLESDRQAVRIMTMHSAKGLEFPIVFLPSLWQRGIKRASLQELQLESDPEDPDCYLGFVEDRDRVIRKSSAENLRLGYVALTRAVHFCVYYNARGLGKQHGMSNQAHGWFDQWLFAQRGETYPCAPQECFLSELSQAEPIAYEAIEKPPALEPRRFDRRVSHAYQITSYSALARMETEVSAEVDPSVPSGLEDRLVGAADLPRGEVTARMRPDLLLESFPGGVRTGTCVHELLERFDFTDTEQGQRLAESVILRHFPDSTSGLLQQRSGEVNRLFGQLTQRARTGANGLTVDLARLRPGAGIAEMEFYFPVQAVNQEELETVLRSWAGRVGLDYPAVPYQPREIDGFLTGSVDLFFRQGQRYYLLDWKTNRPLPGQPPVCGSYSREGMHAHMCHGRYYLQALIYSVATTAYLRQRLGTAFDWNRHVGGFIYCFVRGLGATTGWLHESFSESEVEAAARALGQSPGKKGAA